MVHRTRQQRTAKRPVRIKTVLARMLIGIAIASSSLGWMPAIAARADGLDGDTYSSEEYGWSVEFDDRVWEAEESGGSATQGIVLTGQGAFVNLTSSDNGMETADDCFELHQLLFKRGDSWEDFKTERRLEAPKTPRTSQGGLFTATFLMDGNEHGVVIYLECREVEAATLAIVVVAEENQYEDALPDIEELLDAIDIGPVKSSDRDDDDDEDASENSTPRGQDTIRISGSSGSSPSKRVSLDAGQYRVSVRGTASGDFGGLFSVTIEGSGYYELPINDVIEDSGSYSSSSEVFIESSGSATISVMTLGLDDWTLTLTPLGSSGAGADDGDDSNAGASSGGQDTIKITGTNGSSPSKRVNLDAGQYRVNVSGNAPQGFGGLFSVTIEGSGYYELPINKVIQGSGPYSASSEVYIDSSGSATISVTTLGLDDWTLTLTLVDPA